MINLNKKQLKKFKSIQSKLLAEGLQIEIETSSRRLVVGNGGVHNGVCPAMLLKLLKCKGEVESFNVVPGKSYVIVNYVSLKSSEDAYNSLQSTEIEKSDGGPKATLYFYYLSLNCSGGKAIKTLQDAQRAPEGLCVVEDFITEDEEEELIRKVERDIEEQADNKVQEELKHRRVVHYGYKFRYGSNDVDLEDPLAEEGMPEHVTRVVDKLVGWDQKPDQCTVNRYDPGHGISQHVDNPDAFSSTISSLSLGSPVIFEMRHPAGSMHSFLLKPRSLLTMKGESRYEWTHGIKARKVDLVVDPESKSEALVHRGVRWSLTFRKVEMKSEEKKMPLTGSNRAVEIEQAHVHKVYDKIAEHFASTREKPWPNVVKFLNGLDSNSLVLDVGCGSGRYLKARSDLCIVGCDRSSSLIDICNGKHPFVLVCDGLLLPWKSGHFDACICIAVIHHYFTEERRKRAIREILRVLRGGGRALVYVWASEQKYKNSKSSYLKPSSKDRCEVSQLEKLTVDGSSSCTLPIHKNRNNFAEQDMFVPWKNKSKCDENTHYRFYHVFKEGELNNLFLSVGGCSIVDSYHDNGNWATIVQKDK